VLLRLAGQSRDVLPVERGRRALRVVLVIDAASGGRVDEARELTFQPVQPLPGGRVLCGQRARRFTLRHHTCLPGQL
jgi:hypothetical protein